MLRKSLVTLFTQVILASVIPAALGAPSAKNGVYVADVYVPPIRNDDQFYIIDIDYNGQTLPTFVDTGSADLFVAGDQCNVVDSSSGCYLSETYKIGKSKLQQWFSAAIGEGIINGNNTFIPVTIGGLEVKNFPTAIIHWAAPNEFQHGSFSGIMGLSPRNVSQNLYENQELPLIDTMITHGLLNKPMFSLTFPRLGDPDRAKGKLTIGDVEPLPKDSSMVYADVLDTISFAFEGNPLVTQSWTAALQEIRMNGQLIPVSKGRVNPTGKYISLMDSGSQQMLFLIPEFEAIANAFVGKTVVNGDYAVYFDCSVPQLLELKYNDVWYPVDPLDLIIPSDHGSSNGTELCRAAIGSWDRGFGDSIIGVPFLRNVVSAFDYVSEQMYSAQPRLGFASTTNAETAMKRYGSLYRNRLLSTVPIRK